MTGIHRIRVDAPDPLFWDLLWFALFGVLPLLAAWLMKRRGGGGGGRATAAALALAALVAGPWAALPAADPGDERLVLFAPGVRPSEAFDALGSVDARIIWSDAAGGAWVVQAASREALRPLYSRGALFIAGGAGAFGCASWTRSAGG